MALQKGLAQRNWLRLTADEYPQPYSAYSALRPPQLPLWLHDAGAASGHSTLVNASDSVTSSSSGTTSAPRRLAEFGVTSVHFSEQDEWTYVHHILAEAVPSPIIDHDGFVWEANIDCGLAIDNLSLSPSPSLMFDNMGGGCEDHTTVGWASPVSSSYFCLICVRSAPELLRLTGGDPVPLLRRVESSPPLTGTEDSTWPDNSARDARSRSLHKISHGLKTPRNEYSLMNKERLQNDQILLDGPSPAARSSLTQGHELDMDRR